MVDWCTMSGCDTRISWYSSVGTLYRLRCCDVSRMGTAITYKIDLAIIWTRGSLLRIGKSTKQNAGESAEQVKKVAATILTSDPSGWMRGLFSQICFSDPHTKGGQGVERRVKQK